MSRSTDEWCSRTDDSAIPPRVKVLLYLDAKGRCQKCTRLVDGAKVMGEYDHIIPLILGGENRQSNLQLLCTECHAGKTRLDVKLKAKVARVRKKHIGLKKPRTIRSWRRFDGSIVNAARER